VHCSTNDDVRRALSQRPGPIVHVHDDALHEDVLGDVRAERPVVRSWHNPAFACASATQLLAGRSCDRAHGPMCLVHVGTRRCIERPNPLPALLRWRSVGPSLAGARHDAATIFHSEYLRSVGLRNGFAADRTHVMRYFVEREPGPLAIPGERAVCFAGRLAKLKGVDVLLTAVAETAAVQRVDIVGDGYHRAELERLAARLGLSRRARFHGWLGAEATRDVMAAADVVVVPSEWPEPFGIVGLEAMSLGRPTVGSAVGGIPEWLSDGEVGRLVAPSQPRALAAVLSELLDRPDTLQRMGRAAWERAADFSPGPHVEALEALYAELA
jgi:glycosyltransferase involved in cell wall biosynthesis